jgi:hypothetical protein
MKSVSASWRTLLTRILRKYAKSYPPWKQIHFISSFSITPTFIHQSPEEIISSANFMWSQPCEFSFSKFIPDSFSKLIASGWYSSSLEIRILWYFKSNLKLNCQISPFSGTFPFSSHRQNPI